MKLFVFLLVLLEALPLTTSARPIFARQNQQQALGISSPPPSSVNSFDSSSSSSSSDLSSGSERASKKPLSFSTALKKITKPSSPSSSDFRCHRYPQKSILSELSAYVTDLLRSYRETVFGGKGGNQERPLFETCYAGYESSDVAPSIYFGNMKARQMGTVEKLLRNRLLTKFPDVRIVKTSSTIAVVMDEK